MGRTSREAAAVNPSARVLFCRSASEMVMLAMACLAPWAFGATEAWAEFALDIGVAVIAILGFVAARTGRLRRRARHPATTSGMTPSVSYGNEH